jgi:predicted small lipoprotein YifL
MVDIALSAFSVFFMQSPWFLAPPAAIGGRGWTGPLELPDAARDDDSERQPYSRHVGSGWPGEFLSAVAAGRRASRSASHPGDSVVWPYDEVDLLTGDEDGGRHMLDEYGAGPSMQIA